MRRCTASCCVALVTGLALLVAAAASWMIARTDSSSGQLDTGPMRSSYKTRFSADESPISEHENWISGRLDGQLLGWAAVTTAGGVAFGTQSGLAKPPRHGCRLLNVLGFNTCVRMYDDSTALLAGNWAPDQAAEATVHTVNPNEDIYEEVELRLRSSQSPRIATGYEILFRCSKSPRAYAAIVRWNGRLGDFTYLASGDGEKFGVTEGDVVRATAVGDVITAYINGVQVLQASDGTYRTGKPGIGFYLDGKAGVNRDYGFTEFHAWQMPGSFPYQAR